MLELCHAFQMCNYYYVYFDIFFLRTNQLHENKFIGGIIFLLFLFDFFYSHRQVQKSANFYRYVRNILFPKFKSCFGRVFFILYDTPQRQRGWQRRKQNNIL